MNDDDDDELSHTAMLYTTSLYCNYGLHYVAGGREECENVVSV